MNIPEWMNKKAVAIVAIVCITIIIVAALLRPPRYQKAGINNASVLDTRTGKIYRGGVR